MTSVTSSSLRVTTLRRRSHPSGYRRVINALAVGLATVTMVVAAVMGIFIGLGRMFAVSLDVRSDIRSVVAIAPSPDRLAWAASPAGEMAARWPVIAEFLTPAVVADAPLQVVASALDTETFNTAGSLAIVAPDAQDSRNSSSMDEIYTGSFGAGVSGLAMHDIAKPAPADDMLADRALMGDAPAPKPMPRPRPRLASLGDFERKPDDDARVAKTAIYDIASRAVYLPNGERLEAHSGIGDMMDDARSMRQKNRGVTPPNTYDLTLRESLFHGVRAIRLTPVNDKEMYGRDGILAHTYMLGPSGQSNGCVSFRNYEKFLQAYLRGDINRMVVTTHLDKPPTMFARGNIRSASAL